MSMRIPRFAALASSLLLAAGAALFGAGQAAAAAQADFGYVALGDSYSSGVGAGELRRRQWRLQAHHPCISGPVGRRSCPADLLLRRVLGRPYG